MVIQGTKDRSKIREHMVARKQGRGDESEVREENLGRTRRWVFMGRRGDLGKIHRSRGFSVQECRKREKSGGTRTARCPKGEGNQ